VVYLTLVSTLLDRVTIKFEKDPQFTVKKERTSKGYAL